MSARSQLLPHSRVRKIGAEHGTHAVQPATESFDVVLVAPEDDVKGVISCDLG
jgi:hypothetical protein